jgi:hypothetical protein
MTSPAAGLVRALYLAQIVTVNALFAGFVSVPNKVAAPVVENVPARVGVKFTVTMAVAPPLIVPGAQVIVPPKEPAAGCLHCGSRG